MSNKDNEEQATSFRSSSRYKKFSLVVDILLITLLITHLISDHMLNKKLDSIKLKLHDHKVSAPAFQANPSTKASPDGL